MDKASPRRAPRRFALLSHTLRRVFLAGLCLALLAPPLAAQQAAPSARVRDFARFLALASPLCQHQAARACVDAGWRFADRDRDGRIALAELEEVRSELRDWLAWPDNGIRTREKRGVLLGLLIVDVIGLKRLLASYDTGADGLLSREELLSDLRLDGRPLGEIFADSQAVDWEALRGRLGAMAGALGALAPGAAE